MRLQGVEATLATLPTDGGTNTTLTVPQQTHVEEGCAWPPLPYFHSPRPYYKPRHHVREERAGL